MVIAYRGRRIDLAQDGMDEVAMSCIAVVKYMRRATGWVGGFFIGSQHQWLSLQPARESGMRGEGQVVCLAEIGMCV